MRCHDARTPLPRWLLQSARHSVRHSATPGGVVIEKHLRPRHGGPDHAAGLLPTNSPNSATVKQVTRIRGDGRKHPVQAELANLPLVRKNIAARAALAAGAVLRHERE